MTDHPQKNHLYSSHVRNHQGQTHTGLYPITAEMPKTRLNFSKGECWSIRLNVRFATKLHLEDHICALLDGP